MKVKVKKRMKRVMALLLSIALVLAACGKKEEKESKTKKENPSEINIGLSFDSFLIERWQRDCDVFVAAAKAYDSRANVNVQNANGDIKTQINQIRYLIEKKVDVLVIVCIDSDSLSGVVSEAKEAGIPVIAYDRLIKNADVDLYISFDNRMVGSLMAQSLVDSGLPNKKVVMLSGPNEDNNVSMVEAGFKDVMSDNGIEIVDVYHTPGWKAEDAADYIGKHPELLEGLDAIMCGNDNIATTVIRRLSELRLAGKIKIVGQDADLEACQRIVEGTQVMTVYKPVEKLAKAAAYYAIKLAKKESIEGDVFTDTGSETSSSSENGLATTSDTSLGTATSASASDAMATSVTMDVMSDGSFDIPYFYLSPIAVTKDNMDATVIDSRFHQKNEVYMNVKEP